MYLHLLLLALCLGFFLTHNFTFIAINGLVGRSLAQSSPVRRAWPKGGSLLPATVTGLAL